MGMTFEKPHAASQDDITDIVNRFTHAAEFLHKAGFDGIQVPKPWPPRITLD